MTDVVNSPKWAFDKLFQSFHSSKSEQTLEENVESESSKNLPPCLQTITAGCNQNFPENKSLKIPCLICGKLFKTARSIVQHSNQHLTDFKDNSTSMQDVECCFCGLSFQSSVSLSVHQMSVPVVLKSCWKCRRQFQSEIEFDQHVCPQKRLKSNEKFFVDFFDSFNQKRLLVCPLGCPPKRRKFLDPKNLLTHLVTLHGCEPQDVRVQFNEEDGGEVPQVSIGGSEFLKECPVCKVSVNTLNIRLEDHIFFHCFKRGPLQQELIKQLLKFAQENAFSPDMVIRLEMESFWLELETRLKVGTQNSDSGFVAENEDRFHVELNKTRDLKYSPKFLPKNFYSDFLTKMPTQFPLTLDYWRSKKSDLVFIFRVWCDCIDRSYELGQEIGPKHFRFEFLSADLYGIVAEDLPPMTDVKIDAFENRDFKFPETNWSDVEDRPDFGVLNRLESELGFKISGLGVQENKSREERFVPKTIKQKKKKRKIKRKANREKSNKFFQTFVSDENVDVITDLVKKSARYSSSSESEKEEVKEGKRRIRKTWKLRLRENLTKKKNKKSKIKSASSFSTEVEDDPIKEEEISSDEFVPS